MPHGKADPENLEFRRKLDDVFAKVVSSRRNLERRYPVTGSRAMEQNAQVAFDIVRGPLPEVECGPQYIESVLPDLF